MIGTISLYEQGTELITPTLLMLMKSTPGSRKKPMPIVVQAARINRVRTSKAYCRKGIVYCL